MKGIGDSGGTFLGAKLRGYAKAKPSHNRMMVMRDDIGFSLNQLERFTASLEPADRLFEAKVFRCGGIRFEST